MLTSNLLQFYKTYQGAIDGLYETMKSELRRDGKL